MSFIMRRIILAFALLAGISAAMAQSGPPPPVPALPDTDRVTTYSISSSTCSCSAGFALFGDSTDFGNWLTVYINGTAYPFNDPSHGWVITSPTGPLATIPRPITDAVLTFNSAQTGTITIVGARRPRRVSQFTENRGVPARDLNQTVTDLVAQNREVWDLFERTQVYEPGFTPNPLPLAAARSGLFLCFTNPGGQPTTCAPPTGNSGTFAAGSGIAFTGVNPTTISANLTQGQGISITPSGGAQQIATAAGVDTNNPVNGTQTGTYSVQSSDCGNLVPLGGNAFFTVNVGAATTFPANCEFTVANIDQWGTGRGKNLSVSGLTLPIPILYPQQAWKFRRIGSAWFQESNYQLSQAPLGTKLYVDVVNGSNANDCLASGVGNACHDVAWTIMHVIWQSLLATDGSGTGSNAGFDIRLANDPSCVPSTGANCHPGLHMSGAPKQVEGHNSIMIECDSGSATNCTIADSGGAQAIGMYCACNLELQNVGLAGGSGNNNAIQVEKGMVRIEGTGVTLYSTAGNPQLSALDGGTLFCEGGAQINISGGGSYLAQTVRGGTFPADQCTFKWLANVTYSQATLNAATWSLISVTGAAWNLNGFTVTASNNIQCGPGGVVATGGAIASVPGTNTQTGCTASGNGQVN